MSRKDSRDPYATICLSRLTRILDLKMLEDLQELEDSGNVARNLELESHFKPHRSFLEKSTEKFNKIISRRNHHHIFGSSLTDEAVHRILPLIRYLKTCVDKEGLFRISGNKKRQEELKEMIDRGDNLKLGHSKFTAHDVASVLKQFLGELPEPLLTQASQKAYLQVTEISNDQGNAKHIEALQLLFLMIPPEHRALLHNLLELLKMVTEHPDSKMTAYNLAVVFCPNILYCIKSKVICISNIPQEMDVMNEAVAFMVNHAHDLFKIPEDLKKELKLLEKNMSVGKDEVPMSHTYCQRVDDKGHRQQAQETTSAALVELYNHVKDMPDGPMKHRFMEKFEKTHPGTPPFMPRSKSRAKTTLKPSQLSYSTPIRSTCTPSSLARPPLSPITMDNTTITSSRDVTSARKAVTFRSPDAPRHATRATLCRGAPYKAVRTPSGLITQVKSPHKTVSVFSVSKHKRTLTSDSPNLSPFRRRRTRTAHAPSVQTLSIQTPSGRMVYSPDPYNTPSVAVRKMYGSPSVRKRITSSDYKQVEETFV